MLLLGSSPNIHQPILMFKYLSITKTVQLVTTNKPIYYYKIAFGRKYRNKTHWRRPQAAPCLSFIMLDYTKLLALNSIWWFSKTIWNTVYQQLCWAKHGVYSADLNNGRAIVRVESLKVCYDMPSRQSTWYVHSLFSTTTRIYLICESTDEATDVQSFRHNV